MYIPKPSSTPTFVKSYKAKPHSHLHRLTTVNLADRVVVDEGQIIESGTHAELVAKGGRYAALWQTYLDGTAELRDSERPC